jgi:hypothetical protein
VEDLSLHILDIAENSINARATLVQILLAEDREKDLFTVVIKDNGKNARQGQLQQQRRRGGQ